LFPLKTCWSGPASRVRSCTKTRLRSRWIRLSILNCGLRTRKIFSRLRCCLHLSDAMCRPRSDNTAQPTGPGNQERVPESISGKNPPLTLPGGELSSSHAGPLPSSEGLGVGLPTRTQPEIHFEMRLGHGDVRGSWPAKMVGAVRFELTTSCTRNKRATRLRYAPTQGAESCPLRWRKATMNF
jgi:hypothetical protein